MNTFLVSDLSRYLAPECPILPDGALFRVRFHTSDTQVRTEDRRGALGHSCYMVKVPKQDDFELWGNFGWSESVPAAAVAAEPVKAGGCCKRAIAEVFL